MDYYFIEQFNNTGIAIATYTGMGHGCWLSNNPEGHQGYREVAEHFGITVDDMAATFQRHSGIVKVVTREQAGKHVMWRPDPIEVADGIVTNERNFMISSMESDCTPVYILDPVAKAIGMVHSGWKGTSKGIAVNAVKLMEESFGSRAEDIMIAFGPCICEKCYEVGSDLIPPFSEFYSSDELEKIFLPRNGVKYSLDVKEAIRISLRRIGVKEENMFDSGFCTYHDRLFYSHRRQIKEGLPTTDNMFTGIMLL